MPYSLKNTFSRKSSTNWFVKISGVFVEREIGFISPEHNFSGFSQYTSTSDVLKPVFAGVDIENQYQCFFFFYPGFL